MRSLVIFLLAVVFLVGCRITPRNEYIDGTSFTLGLYIPMNGNIYGIQAVNYLSGKRITTYTNDFPSVESTHTVSNSTFGVFSLTEHNTTKIR